MKKYEQLYRRIKADIESGLLGEGEKLLSIREEARTSALSVNTVISAYELLTDEGLIRSRERGAYRVCSGARGLTKDGHPKASGQSHQATAREAGERLDQLYERLLRIDPSFASAAPALDILPGKELDRILSGLNPSWMNHSDPQGDSFLRERLELFNRDYNGTGTGEDLVVTNGATEGLSLALRLVLSPGDRVALESPVYFNFFHQLHTLGVEIVEIPMADEGMDLNILEKEIRKRPVKLILTQPNVQNPTGITMTENRRQELLKLAEGEGIYLIQDDVFGDLSYSPIRPRNLSALSDYPRLFQVSSYSKSIAPGLRVGWIRSPRFAKELAESKLRLSMESSRLAQAALASFLGTKDHRRHLLNIRRALSDRGDDHLSLLSTILPPGSYVRRPSGGCLLWIEYPERVNTTELFERAACGGLIATPGIMFSSGNYYNNCLRLNTGHRLSGERAQKLKLLGLNG